MNYFQTLLLNFFGLQKGDAGLTFVCEDPFDARLTVFANTRGNRYSMEGGRWKAPDPIAAFSSVWLASLGSLRYPRRLAIQAHGSRGYVESCEIYRRWLDEKGWTRTLRDKIKQNPEREKLIGSTHIDVYGGYPHYAPEAPASREFHLCADRRHRRQPAQRTETRPRVDTAWGTFENYPPNCWPINSKRGGAVEWKKAVDAAKRAGYLIAGYHAYSPMLEQDPNFDPRLVYQPEPDAPDPARRLRVMRWLRTCGSLSLDYARRNLPRELEAAGQTGDFTDIIGTHPGSECYDTTHHRHNAPLTREQDIRNHNALLSYIHDELNLPSWIERGSAAMLKTTDAFHGAAEMERQFAAIGIAVPLLSLVAHDCVVVRQHPEQTHRDPEGQFHTRLLMNIVQGNPPIHCVQAWEYAARKQDIAALHNVLAKIHRQVGLAKMTEHRFLPGIYGTDNFHVQKSVFSDGTRIYVNFGLEPHRDAEVSLEGYGFEARLANGEMLKGAAESGLRLR